jgi:acyl carrier protein
MEVLGQILASGLPQVLVSPRDLEVELTAVERLRREELEVSHASAPDPRPALDTPYNPPRDSLERALAEIWQELLGVERVGIDDNFFELGGHSLLATRMASRMRARLGIEVPLDRMLAAPTVAGLAAVIGATGEEQADEASLSALLSEIEGLSEEEVQAMLDARPPQAPFPEQAG